MAKTTVVEFINKSYNNFNFCAQINRAMAVLYRFQKNFWLRVQHRNMKKRVLLNYWELMTVRCRELYFRGYYDVIKPFHGERLGSIAKEKRDLGILEIVN
jgi:hypothetical protein